jgi:hypothetical protein
MIQRVLEDVLAEAVNHAPSLIILDDLDGLIPCGLEGPKPATTVVALAEFLGDLIDLYQVYATGLCLVISTVLATYCVDKERLEPRTDLPQWAICDAGRWPEG